MSLFYSKKSFVLNHLLLSCSITFSQFWFITFLRSENLRIYVNLCIFCAELYDFLGSSSPRCQGSYIFYEYLCQSKYNTPTIISQLSCNINYDFKTNLNFITFLEWTWRHNMSSLQCICCTCGRIFPQFIQHVFQQRLQTKIHIYSWSKNERLKFMWFKLWMELHDYLACLESSLMPGLLHFLWILVSIKI